MSVKAFFGVPTVASRSALGLRASGDRMSLFPKGDFSGWVSVVRTIGEYGLFVPALRGTVGLMVRSGGDALEATLGGIFLGEDGRAVTIGL